jgi:hypothetical protein
MLRSFQWFHWLPGYQNSGVLQCRRDQQAGRVQSVRTNRACGEDPASGVLCCELGRPTPRMILDPSVVLRLHCLVPYEIYRVHRRSQDGNANQALCYFDHKFTPLLRDPDPNRPSPSSLVQNMSFGVTFGNQIQFMPVLGKMNAPQADFSSGPGQPVVQICMRPVTRPISRSVQRPSASVTEPMVEIVRTLHTVTIACPLRRLCCSSVVQNRKHVDRSVNLDWYPTWT